MADPGGPVPALEGSVLTVHMAALAHVLAARHQDTAPTDPGQLSAYLLSRERSHWQSMYDNDRRISSSPQVMGRAVYVAALTRSLDYPAAVAALKSAGLTDTSAAAGQLLDDHAMCYPPHDPATVLEPLYPDRLAEDFVALQTPGHAIGGFRPDPWAAGVLGDLLDHDIHRVSTMLPLLIEASRRWPHLADTQLVPLLRRRPQLAVQGGSPALSALAAAPAIPLDLIAAIESALPPDPPANLYAGIAAITERLAAEAPADPSRDLKLGWRLLNSGRIAESITPLTRAVATARRRPTGSAADLELALRVLGQAHVQAESWAAAAAVLSEAVGLWTTARRPAPEIADTLGALSVALSRQGDDQSSLAVRDRAIAQLRSLVAVDPRHRMTLVRALVQQADQLRRKGRLDDALKALDDAADLLREIAGGLHVGLEADFAATLLGRARTLLSLKRLDEAAFAVSGAVRIFGGLAGRNVSFDQALAEAFVVESSVLSRLERSAEAVDAQESAVSIYRRLDRISTERHGPDLARALIAFAQICRGTARRQDDALDAVAESIRLLRTWRPSSALSQLLRAAQELGADLLAASGRHDEAEALRASVRIESPDEERPWNHEPVSNSADLQPDLGELALTLYKLRPARARFRLEGLKADQIAGVLMHLELTPSWLEAFFSGFAPHRTALILQRLVARHHLIYSSVLARFVESKLDRASVRLTAYLLADADPAEAAGFLNRSVYWKAQSVLTALESSRRRDLIPYLDVPLQLAARKSLLEE